MTALAEPRRVAAAALVLGPLLFLIANLLHPEELPADREAEQLAAIAEAYQRWQAAHAITFLAVLGFAAAVVALAFLVGRRDQRLGLAGGVLGMVGLMALMGVLAIDGFAWGIAGEVWGKSPESRPAAELVLDDMQHSEWGLQFYVTGVTWILGMVVLALGAVRTGLIPAWAGVLLAVGSLMVGLEGAIHSNVYFVIASVAMLVGGAAVAAALAKPNGSAGEDTSSRPPASA